LRFAQGATYVGRPQECYVPIANTNVALRDRPQSTLSTFDAMGAARKVIFFTA
jgi:hypothetical protein